MTERRHKSNRHIIKRIIVRGTLVLDTPTCLGNGDADSPTDLPLLRDSISNHALLTGSSIAGALRNYLRECNKGYNVSDRRHDLTTKLFGDLFAYENEKTLTEAEKIELRSNDTQSSLIINDALSVAPIKAELRDGVKINSVTRTAQDKAKYDLELLEAGTQFPLCLELLIDKETDEAELVKAIALALHGLESSNRSKSGEICIGMKKRRGFGRCYVENWQVWQFNLQDPKERINWLNFEHWSTGLLSDYPTHQSIATALGVSLDEEEDRRDRFLIHATFKLVGSLLIRSGQDTPGLAPDVVHLKSHRPGETDPVPVLSGTSLAGVLRHRAERIINTLNKPTTIIDEIFGFDFSKDKSKEAKASRLVVGESIVKDTADLVQTRIAIDRFTGGTYQGALFQEQPIFGQGDDNLKIELELRDPKNYEIGLLLLLLKDLWTQDLPVGGASSVGRGRLQGKTATLTRYEFDKNKNKMQPQTWHISQPDLNEQKLDVSKDDQKEMENYVQSLADYCIQ
ncbi:RAMP superfamily CRISPR-associated protein [Allocoleopsis franciscana]|uniref:Putative RAMP superfamily protein probably involved in DNA repair n=1 Tax=Allocoleopsis franciscana PCC 7113 TaxID=1173027 RepID=K9WFV4_9CYAN|nr:RAMP superfamily CRISPR-associated protein [Allocoleopsis franciscana]AFZ18417.1 putative RAMP superfamily protein probably involved in DNA repair [Allocoleopsis franciscana PCC 7113]